ncbi:MAG: 50S ribosomal protein L24e, partial [Thermoplasmata archaeon]
MVVKRQCSFCADEIEPGTGMMFVKRDGTIFNFCSSSCRKQQLHLGRVGHRRKWTRAHAMKRAQAHAQGRGATAAKPTAAAPKPSEPAAPAAAPSTAGSTEIATPEE